MQEVHAAEFGLKAMTLSLGEVCPQCMKNMSITELDGTSGGHVECIGKEFANSYLLLPSEIYLMPSAGGTPEKITDKGMKHFYPKWIRMM